MEKFKPNELYVKEGLDKGRVEDPEIAREMADREEESGRKRKMFGLRKPSEEDIQKGERYAELWGKIRNTIDNSFAKIDYDRKLANNFKSKIKNLRIVKREIIKTESNTGAHQRIMKVLGKDKARTRANYTVAFETGGANMTVDFHFNDNSSNMSLDSILVDGEKLLPNEMEDFGFLEMALPQMIVESAENEQKAKEEERREVRAKISNILE